MNTLNDRTMEKKPERTAKIPTLIHFFLACSCLSISTAQLSGILGMHRIHSIEHIARNWWRRLRLKTFIKCKQQKLLLSFCVLCATQTKQRERENFFGIASPKIVQIFNYSRWFCLLFSQHSFADSGSISRAFASTLNLFSFCIPFY